jgi:hypothetical protein
MRASQIRIIAFLGMFLAVGFCFLMWYLGWIGIIVATLLTICIFISAYFLNAGLKKAIDEEQHATSPYYNGKYR